MTTMTAMVTTITVRSGSPIDYKHPLNSVRGCMSVLSDAPNEVTGVVYDTPGLAAALGKLFDLDLAFTVAVAPYGNGLRVA